MNKKSIAANIVWSTISLLISTAITMLVLPYVSDALGIEAYGYIALSNNIIAYIDLVSSIINVYAIRFISIDYHKGDIEKANIYYNSVLKANIIISIALLIPSTICIAYIDSIIDVPTNLINDVRLLFSLAIINYIIATVGSIYSTTTFVKDILYKDSEIRSVSSLIRGGLILFLFGMFCPHVWYTTLATIAGSAFIVFRNIKITHRYTPEFKINFKCTSVEAIKEIAAKGIWNTIASLGTTLNSGLDLLVTNVYLGATKMGQLSVPKTLSTFVTVLLNAITNSFRPQLLRYYINGDKQALDAGFVSSMKLCGIVTSTIFCVFAGFGSQFLNLWIPNQDTVLIFQLVILTFLSDTFTGFVKPLHYGAVLTGKLKIPCMANLLVGVFNIISMMILLSVTDWGLYVVALTTVVGNIGYNFIIMPLYVTYILSMKRRSFYLLILRYTLTTAFIMAVLYFSCSRIQIFGWLSLILGLIIATAFAVFAYIVLILNKQEKKELLDIAKRKLPFFDR